MLAHLQNYCGGTGPPPPPPSLSLPTPMLIQVACLMEVATKTGFTVFIFLPFFVGIFQMSPIYTPTPLISVS